MGKLIIICDKLVDIWREFLDSLATVGGNIFILLVLSGLAFLGVIHVLHHTEVNKEAAGLLLSSFSSISGALLYALTQRQKSGNGNGDFKKAISSTDPKDSDVKDV